MALRRIETGLTNEERLPAVLLLVLIVILCAAGGASREDVLAQSVVRGCAVIVVILQVAVGRLPRLGRYPACFMLLGGMAGIAALQLVPLPPSIWTALPGRAIIAASPAGESMWRPIDIVPDAGWNALFSLLVPMSILVLASCLEDRTVRRLRYPFLGAIVFSALVALLQAAGTVPDNPLINGTTADYAGIFANRNHQALFLAVGIVLAWFWGLERGGDLRDRQLWVAVSLILLMGISILVAGSRSGILLAGIAMIFGPLLAILGGRRPGASGLSGIAWSVGSFVVLSSIISLGLYFGRAQSVDRFANLGLADEFRVRSFPIVWQAAKTYFPFGAGLGSFDAVFRVAEPLRLLEPTYLNHAHNDFLETVIETGIFGPLVLAVAFLWLARRSVVAMGSRREGARIARASVLIVGLVLLASLLDYPARTPMIMALLAAAGCWLTDVPAGAATRRASNALPSRSQTL